MNYKGFLRTWFPYKTRAIIGWAPGSDGSTRPIFVYQWNPPYRGLIRWFFPRAWW